MGRQEEFYRVPYIDQAGVVKDNLVSGQQDLVKVRVPGSKSITNRALLLATLAEGTSRLQGALFSDDSRHFLKCVQELGFKTRVDEEKTLIEVTGSGGRVPKREAFLNVGSAGTAARFLTAFLGVSEGTFHMDASAQMRKRPMAPLLDSLEKLGCEILYGRDMPGELPVPGKKGFFPFTLKSHGFGSNEILINIGHSSQFLSALLIASCLSAEDFSIRVEGKHGMSYIDMTVKMMEQFGVVTEKICSQNTVIYQTPKGQSYQAREYRIEPDVSAACYFYALVPLLHVAVIVEGVHRDSMQGDIAFLEVLEQMGCIREETEQGILLKPPVMTGFPGVTVDMSAFSDQAITLAALAPFAQTPTTITGIGHIRLQESDRIAGIVTELGKMGIGCKEGEDSVTIYPGEPRPSEVETYDDHRMAMGFSLIGLKADGIVIKDPGCCRKTFENYFEVLEDAVSQIEKFPLRAN